MVLIVVIRITEVDITKTGIKEGANMLIWMTHK